MAEERKDLVIKAICDGFLSISKDLGEREFSPQVDDQAMGQEKIAVILSMISGDESMKGRFLFEGDTSQIKDLTEGMNGEPLSDRAEIFFSVGEFANMVCGKAVTVVNNAYKGTNFRLTPPAIFSGTNMDITTPSIHSVELKYRGPVGLVRIDVGFEGV